MNRATGKPIFGVAELPVPQTEVTDERLFRARQSGFSCAVLGIIEMLLRLPLFFSLGFLLLETLGPACGRDLDAHWLFYMKHPRRHSTQRKAKALDRARELLQAILDGRRNPYEGYRELHAIYTSWEPERLEVALSTPRHRA